MSFHVRGRGLMQALRLSAGAPELQRTLHRQGLLTNCTAVRGPVAAGFESKIGQTELGWLGQPHPHWRPPPQFYGHPATSYLRRFGHLRCGVPLWPKDFRNWP